MVERLRFDAFELDPHAGELLRDGRPVKLAPQPAKVLAALARRPGSVVTRDELRREIWGDGTHVDFEGSLHSCVKQIRAALGDSPSGPRYIETLPRRGYRFLAEVRPATTERSRSRLSLAGALGAAAAVLVGLISLSALLASSGGTYGEAPPEAVDALLKARYHLEKRDPASLPAAEKYFLEAIASRGDFAAAHTGLAEVHLRRAMGYGDADAYAAAVAASARALEIAPSAESHFLHALAVWFGRWDWEGAAAAFTRALTLDPELARAHHWHAYYLTGVGRHDEALAEIERARELDPLSPAIQSDVGWFYFFARRYDEALAASRRTLELEPGFLLAEDCIVECYLALGKQAEALHQAAGFAKRDFEDMEALWRFRLDSGRGPYDGALAALRLGDVEGALARLREAVERRSLWLPVLSVDPRWSALREHPGFARLERAIRSAGKT